MYKNSANGATHTSPILYSRAAPNSSSPATLANSLLEWLEDFDDKQVSLTDTERKSIKEYTENLKRIMEANMPIASAIHRSYEECLQLSETTDEEIFSLLEAYEQYLKTRRTDPNVDASDKVKLLLTKIQKIQFTNVALLEKLVTFHDQHELMRFNAHNLINEIAILAKCDFKKLWREWPEFFPNDFRVTGIMWEQGYRMLPRKLDLYVAAAKQEIAQIACRHTKVKCAPQ